ncbi:MAG: rRNA cytosine-C5-methylase [Rikenellaceae bacterium]
MIGSDNILESRSIALPAQFVDTLRAEMGTEVADELVRALDGESPTSIRVNPYKMAEPPTEGDGVRRVPWSRYGYYLAERPYFTYESEFHAGAYYVQEASSQFMGHILASASESFEGAKVLDCCAAPGGKTTLYSTLVGLDGLVVAGEINRSRASVLADNVRRWGLGNVVVVNGDVSQLSQFESIYDAVAVDAPCSGEGMFRKSEGAREEWNEGSAAMCAKRQSEILKEAWRALKPGGVLIYSTCTFNRAENEETVAQFEEWCDGEVARFDDVELSDEWGVLRSDVGEFQTFRFLPHRCEGEGFFAAVARKSFDAGGRVRMPKSRKAIFSSLSRVDLAECSRWVEQPEMMSFYGVGETIYGYYNAHLDLIKRLAESLTVIYSGVAIGQIFKGKMSPDGALALFVGVNREAMSLSTLKNDEMLSYLKKGDVEASLFEEGINLVVDESGYSVGFAKRIGARVNNRYPNSLRILK